MISKSKRSHLVIGAGAVGQALTTFIHQSGEDVSLLARGATAKSVREKGIKRTGTFGEAHVEAHSINIIDKLNSLDEPVDTVFICTKAFDTVSVVEQLSSAKQAINENTTFVVCQNGWGSSHLIASTFGKQSVLNARIMTGFVRRDSEIAVTVHAQAIRIGSLFDHSTTTSESVCKMLCSGGLPAEASSKIERDIWAKMLFNCIVNPLGALFNVPLGALIGCPEMRLIIDGVATEVFQVMKVSGYETYWRSSPEYLDSFYSTFIPLTATHISSMLQDIQSGSRTEIDALNGAIVRIGDELSIPIEQNRMIYNLVKYAEQRDLFSCSSRLQVA